MQKVGARVRAYCNENSHEGLLHFFSSAFPDRNTTQKPSCKLRLNLENQMTRMIKHKFQFSSVRDDVLEICKEEFGLDADEAAPILVQYGLSEIDDKLTKAYKFPEDIPRGPLKG